MEDPENYKLYSIQCCNKEYEVIGEVLFALVINEFISKVEKEFIISEIIIELPNDNDQALSRIQQSLNILREKENEIIHLKLDEDISEEEINEEEDCEEDREFDYSIHK